MWGLLGVLAGGFGMILPGSPLFREATQQANRLLPNEVMDMGSLVMLRRTGVITDDIYYSEMARMGIADFRATQLLSTFNKYPDGSALVDLVTRGKISDGVYSQKMQQVGYSSSDAEMLKELARNKLGTQEVITAWRRGLFSEGGSEDYFNDLRQVGWTDDRIELLKQVTEFFPTPSDLIQFAVREVYTPETRDKFGMDEDLPPQFLQEASKAGLPEEQARNYWAAHWQLPSPLQGFEMLHRGVIEQDELELLLKSLDVMPFWREKLTQISYNPLTRVDVRRMHALGILDRDGVLKSYKDIGYNDENAELMTRFTIDYNEGDPVEDETQADKEKRELEGLTRSSIVKAYGDRLISGDEAYDYLIRIGIGEEVAALYLAQEDIDQDEKLDNLIIDTLEKKYVNGAITYNELVSELGKLDLLPEREQKLLTEFEEKKNNKIAEPSKTDVLNWYKGGIINEMEFEEEMENLGYSIKYINRYKLQLSAKK